ncbi:MAG: precorrin-3B C(17)-methyltransferase [Candidatus Puniceispirillales bacterium]
MDLKPPHFIALTHEGAVLARRLADRFGGVAHGKAGLAGMDQHFDEAMAAIRDRFLSGVPVIGVCAAAILIRAIGGHAGSKHDDPPVLAVSDDGAMVIPLLGGHHGANALARMIADETGGTAAITTAGDRRFDLALDAPPPPFCLADADAAKPVMAALLAGEKAQLEIDLPPSLEHLADAFRAWVAPVLADAEEAARGPRLMLSLAPAKSLDADLVFHPKILHLGLGASRGCPTAEMAGLVAASLADARLAREAIAGVYSLDLKADETAILDLAASLGQRLQVFDAPRLEQETPRLSQPSDIVFAEVGCHGVAEGSALAAAGPAASLVLPKQRDAHATMAVALDPTGLFRPEDCRHRGKVMLVGIGPGQSAWRTPEATAMIAAADELVGYGFYIDLLAGLGHGKTRRDFALGEEEARCRYALEEAAKGRDIAIICSGDAGIYAMGALVFELLGRDAAQAGVSDAAKRVEVLTAPGISALQAAAARSGAILGHDFCTISLSDLLTPWDAIETRIKAAATGDFVIAFYNPVSRRRREGLAKAKAILLRHRPDETPVVLATSLGRDEETIRYRRLADLDIDEVDMMTVVMVGASTSMKINRGDGAAVYTPRGYARHLDQPEKDTGS